MQTQPIVFMFSGQGSQYYQMGKELFQQNSIFRYWMQTLNQMVFERTGLWVTGELYHESRGKADLLDKIQISHPAIFMVEYALTRLFLEGGVKPDYVLGASLGEFTAAAVAGVITVEEALDWIIKQTELLPKLCSPGSMIAIIDKPELYRQIPLLAEGSELAAVNYPSHFVISGEQRMLHQIDQFLKTNQILYQKLPVCFGFHSSNVEPLRQEYLSFLRNFRVNRPQIPMVSCVTGELLTEITPEYFWNVIREPIRFPNAIRELEIKGNYRYIDLGPAGTLANFTRQNLAESSKSQYHAIITPFNLDLKNCRRIFDELGLTMPS